MQSFNFDFGPAGPFSVTDLTRHIQQLFSHDDLLRNVSVEGEVSNFRRYPSGHAYFTLKDAQCQLRCVMWKTAIQRQTHLPNDGDRVRARGTVEVYDARGEYQLQTLSIQPLGLGDLYLEFERLKVKLEAEGLFEAAHKRPLPAFPRVIGVVTSPGAAAFQDIQNVLRRRYPLARIVLSPTHVQGDSAPPLIVAALQLLARHGSADVILVARGGGSIEDLWAFNDERVARAIYASPIPVVTGVGHETDFTLVDFVADQRAPTPSAGAELITPDRAELHAAVRELHQELGDALLAQIETARQALAGQVRAMRYLSPKVQIDNRRQRLDELDRRLQSAVRRRIEVARDRLNNQRRALIAINPTNILARGYAIVYRSRDGKRLSDAQDAGQGTSLTVQLQRGQLTATVTGRTITERPSS
ncbi:MAG: exodeoxyribonuclease VII large subunit [Aggregatilineales bacterium]